MASFGAFTRLASRAETLTVSSRHSRVDAGSRLIAVNLCSQSSAESSACADPNNSLTALKNAPNSCSALVIRSAQASLLANSWFIILTVPREAKIACSYAVTVALCRRDAILLILRCRRRSQRRGSEIHAESFAPYGLLRSPLAILASQR